MQHIPLEACHLAEQSGDTEHEENVRDIGAEDVAYHNFRDVGICGVERRNQLGNGGSDADHEDADDKRRHAQSQPDSLGAIYQYTGGPHQGPQAYDKDSRP